ncbi:MAG: fibrillarin-like rRNA/tRNA 2'-O-methyltransferase [Methanomassiliicoccaceae archaeon]|jgi:fibrillarin-like pre-rRNA processing protein|nr:fibrillarin-like rRNA/tRNA 2'-O-methyltransferase [Methanomassiliicoccaceae archaeon]
MMSMLGDRVKFSDGKLMTLSADPGRRVYGERLTDVSGKEYREWSPYRSKLAAYLCLGGSYFPFREDRGVLYLGAASGTTASHISDVAADGRIYCVEFSQRTFRDLVRTCETRKNMIPILGDASSPAGYGFAVGKIEIVYQDIAQKGQADIFADNMEHFNAKCGMISIKARSEDVTARPDRIFDRACERLTERGMRIVDVLRLERYEKAHAMIAVEMMI